MAVECGAGPRSAGPRVGVAPGARSVGFGGLAGTGSVEGTLPRGSGRQLDGAAGEECPALLVGIAGRQRDLDPGLHLGDPGGDLDQREPERVELGVAPERGLGRQAAQRVQQPVGGGVDQQAELVGRRRWCRRCGRRRGAACAP